MVCRTPRDPSWIPAWSPKPKDCCKRVSWPRRSLLIDLATFHMCNKDSCRWPYISSVERVIVLQSCTNNRINGSCAYSIATSLRDRELGRPAWKQNQLVVGSVSRSKIRQNARCTFHRCKATRKLLVALLYSPEFDQHHGGHPCANPRIKPCDRQNLSVRMRSSDGLVRFGSCRIKRVMSVSREQGRRRRTYHKKRDLNSLKVYHVIKRTHGSLDALKQHIAPSEVISAKWCARHSEKNNSLSKSVQVICRARIVNLIQALLIVCLGAMGHHVIQTREVSWQKQLCQTMRQEHHGQIPCPRRLVPVMWVWGAKKDATKTKQVQASSGFLNTAGGFRLGSRIGDEISIDVLHKREMRSRTIVQLHLTWWRRHVRGRNTVWEVVHHRCAMSWWESRWSLTNGTPSSSLILVFLPPVANIISVCTRGVAQLASFASDRSVREIQTWTQWTHGVKPLHLILRLRHSSHARGIRQPVWTSDASDIDMQWQWQILHLIRLIREIHPAISESRARGLNPSRDCC